MTITSAQITTIKYKIISSELDKKNLLSLTDYCKLPFGLHIQSQSTIHTWNPGVECQSQRSWIKLTWTDTFPDDIPISSAWLKFQFLLQHDIFQLLSYLSNLPHSFDVNKMLVTPMRWVTIRKQQIKTKTSKTCFKTYLFCFHWLYTLRYVRWSLSGTWNFSRTPSASSSLPLGR